MNKATYGSLLFCSLLSLPLCAFIPFIIPLLHPFTLLTLVFLYTPFRKPVYFLCKVRLPSVRPVKDRLRLLPENLPPQLVGECIFRILLARAGRQSRGQKNKQPSGTGCIEGKNKK